MKKDEVQIGGLYTAKVSDKVVTVRIDGVNSRGGWNATNTATGKRVRIKSAQRLRAEVRENGSENRTPRSELTLEETEKLAKARIAKAKTQAADKPKRVSALDAAAEVLKAEGKPMRAKDLIEAMTAGGLWSSPNGKTPEATLYAAMIREIATKGSEARFEKVERGMFVHRAGKEA